MSESTGRPGRRPKAARESAVQSKPAAQDLKRALYHCNYCSKDISLVARIKCAVCPDFDLCLECFSVGVEITPHKNDHDYRVVDNLSFPILHMEWGADEEILLLEAIDIYGAGNWASVSEHVGNKTPEHCKRHWFATYIDVDSYPCPTPAPELAHLTEEELRAGHVHVAAHQGGSRKRPRDAEASGPSFLASSHVKQEGDSGGGGGGDRGAVADQIGAGHQSDLKVEEPSAMPSGEAGEPLSGLKRETRAKKEHPEPHPSAGAAAADTQTGHGSVGGKRPAGQHGGASKGAGGVSIPLGQPLGLAAAAATPGPSQPAGWTSGKEVSGKPKIGYDPDGSGYHFKRHDFDPEWDNDAECTIAEMEFTDNDSELDREHKLRVLQIYNKRLDERERRRDFLLSRNLIRVKHFQTLDRRRNAQEREVLARLRVFSRYEAAPGEHDEMVEGILLEHRLRARLQELKEYRRNGIRTLADAEVFDTERRRSKSADQAAALAAKAKSRLGTPLGGEGPVVADDGASAAAAAAKAASTGTFGRSASAALAAWRSRRGLPLDITCLPGVELLGRRERELCAMSRLHPVHYLALKDMMMRDCQKHGPISRQEARTYFRLDPQRCLKLYDLWVSLGWVTTPGGGGGGNTGAKSAAGAGLTPPPQQQPGGASSLSRRNSEDGAEPGGLPPAPTPAWLHSRPIPLGLSLSVGQGSAAGTPVDFSLYGSVDFPLRSGAAPPTPSFGPLDLSASGDGDVADASGGGFHHHQQHPMMTTMPDIVALQHSGHPQATAMTMAVPSGMLTRGLQQRPPTPTPLVGPPAMPPAAGSTPHFSPAQAALMMQQAKMQQQQQQGKRS